MPHRANVNDEDYRSMDGWPAPRDGGEYPYSEGVVPWKIYTDEEEKELHRRQDKNRNRGMSLEDLIDD